MSKIIGRTVIILIFGMLILYLAGAVIYINFYYPNTYIGDRNIGDMSYEEVVSYVDSYYDNYYITIHGLEDYEYHPTITYNKDIVKSIMLKQQSYLWITKFNKRYDITLDYMIDKEQTYKELSELLFTDQVQSQDATVIRGINGYEIKPEVQGNEYYSNEAVLMDIYQKISGMHEDVDITCYLKTPDITSDNAELKEICDKGNKVLNGEFYYQFGDTKETLSGSDLDFTIENGEVKLNHEVLTEFIGGLADKYETVDNKRSFTTTSGEEITLEAGDYGWSINEAETEKSLSDNIINGITGEQEIIYNQEAVSFDGADYGNTYVEVCVAEQHIWYYKDGELIVESDVVTGTPPNSDTPPGVYKLKYKDQNATLKGNGYSTVVSYWMPFNNNVGLHDATWRSSFGGSIYKTSGSHGCVNMPYNAAKTLYENIDVNTAVIVY